MPLDARILTATLRDPLAAIRARGGDADALCAVAGAPTAETAAADPEATMPLAAFVALLDLAAETLRAPDFGWRTGAGLAPHCLGAVGEAIAAAPTAGAALKVLAGAFETVQSGTEMRLSVSGAEAQLSYRILDPDIGPRAQDAELTLGFAHAILRRAARAERPPCAAVFEHAPRAARCGAGPEARGGGAVNALFFPARLLDAALPEARPEAFRRAARAAEAAARRRLAETPVTVRVRRLLYASLGEGETDQTAVASALGLSRRSLRRRLAEEGARFSAVLAECRLRLARRALAETDASLAEIAFGLGYSDQTAFERAFRAWTGVSPAAFRRGREAAPAG